VIGVACAVVLGAVFLLAGAAKLSSPTWPAQAAALGAPRVAVSTVPIVELVVGAALVAGIGRPVAAGAALVLLVWFTVLLVARLRAGVRPPCACFGGRSTRPIGPGSVVRNVVLAGLALVTLLA
jgi:uncharacterized membrane protein YphA (DoxX/SURF4 family)